MDEIICKELKEEARSLAMMVVAFGVLSIPIIIMMRIANIISAQQAGGMLAGALFAAAFAAMFVIMIHAATSDCRRE
jgi:hypothetical protein